MLLSEKKSAGEKPDKWRLQKRWNNSHREARRAHELVSQAVRNGTLKRGQCWCGSYRTEAHHPDYSKPLQVEWLCRLHHRRLHAEIRRASK